MAAGKSVNEMLSDAKETLASSNKLAKSATGGGPSSFAPKHEYSNASYSMARKPEDGLGTELKEKAKMVANARKALDQ